MNNTILIDFKDVIATLEPDSPLQSAQLIEGVDAFIKQLRDNGFMIKVVSPICEDYYGKVFVLEWLRDHNIEVDDVSGIPESLCYISKNSVPFSGNFIDLRNDIEQHINSVVKQPLTSCAVFGIPCLFLKTRISRQEVHPLYRFEIKGSTKMEGMPISIQSDVDDNFIGTILCYKNLISSTSPGFYVDNGNICCKITDKNLRFYNEEYSIEEYTRNMIGGEIDGVK